MLLLLFVWVAATSGDVEGSLREAQRALRVVEAWPEDALPNRPEVLANLHACIGTAHLDLGRTDQALSHFQKSLHLATRW